MVQVSAARSGRIESTECRDNIMKAEGPIIVLIKSIHDRTSPTLTTTLRHTGDANLQVKQRIHFASAYKHLGYAVAQVVEALR